MFVITKNYPADFPALLTSVPNGGVLQVQINAVITSAECQSISISAGVVTMNFDVEPNAADLILIDAVVAAHTGEPFVQGIQKMFSEAVQTEAGTTYVEKASLLSGVLAGGEYQINWYAEISVDTADGTSGVLARVMWNGTERAEAANDLSFYQSFNGSVIVDVDAGTSPTLALELRRVGTPNIARVRRVRMSIQQVGEGGE